MLQFFVSPWKMGATGGLLTTIFSNINGTDIIKSAVLAAVGAAVSFIMSAVLKYFVNRKKQ